MLKKAAKIFLILLIITIVALSIYLFVTYNLWPWWMGLFIACGILFIFFTIVFIKKYLVRKKEKSFVSKLVSTEAPSELKGKAKKKYESEITKKWMEAISSLKKSNLKKKGNPIYALPWYMVMGESGEGKTSCIKNSKQNSPMTEIPGNSVSSSTKNFDWWFFHDSVVLDTAGRYSIPIDEDSDISEWKEFLTLVSRYRKKEPINGLILVISSEKLLKMPREKLNETGQKLRKRTDQIMRALGSIIPIYIMVTKTDLIYGMTEFINMLDDERKDQAMGFAYTANDDISMEDFFDQGFKNLVSKLKDLRLLIIQKEKNISTDISPELLIFPDEFEKIYPGLKSFFHGVFQENPYQENPMFRGIYFSSAIRKGEPESLFASRFDIGNSLKTQAKKESGIFLGDFFKKIITSDRNLFKPLIEFIKWKKLTTRLAILSWLALSLFILGLISFSFWKNMDVMNSFSPIFKNKIRFTGKISTDLILMDSLRLKVMEMEEKNRNWILPRLGFDQTLRMEKEIKDLYERSFHKNILSDLDSKIKKNISGFDHNTNPSLISAYMNHLAGRIEILQYFKEKYNFSMPDDDLVNKVIPSIYPGVYDTISDKFKTDYFYYIKWNKNKNYIDENIYRLRSDLKKIITRLDTLNWLVKKSMEDVNGYSLNNFWGYSSENKDTAKVYIPPAFTEKGKKNITDFIEKIKGVLEDSKDFDEKERNFWAWYQGRYFTIWASFIKNFSKGMDIPDTRELKKEMALKMTANKNPYSKLISAIVEESSSFKNKPEWINSILLVEKASKIEPDKKDGIMEKLKDKGNKVVLKIDPEAAKKRQELLELSKLYHDYQASLSKLEKISSSPKDAFVEASSFFSKNVDQEKGGDSLFFAANDKFGLLKAKLGSNGDNSYSSLILEGPVNYLARFATMESGCLLQEKWEEDIMGAVQGIASYKVPYTIFNNKDGLIYKFIDGPAKAFIGRNKNGFFPNRAFGYELPFNNEFFTYLTKGTEASVSIQPSYRVDIKSIPVDINKGAKKTPYGIVLSLSCADKKFRLVNYNYPSSETFVWSMGSCGDTILKILFKNFTLIKEYKGELGFVNFLNDFKDGVKIFTPEDFQSKTKWLKKEKINKIIVSFNISGSDDLLKIMNTMPEDIPENIVSCWK